MKIYTEMKYNEPPAWTWESKRAKLGPRGTLSSTVYDLNVNFSMFSLDVKQVKREMLIEREMREGQWGAREEQDREAVRSEFESG